MKLTKFILLGLIFSSTANAEIAMVPATVPTNLHVFNSQGNTYVDLVDTGCGSYRYFIDPNYANYNTIVSILMAAQLSGKKVEVRYDGCTAQNQGKVIGVYLKN